MEVLIILCVLNLLVGIGTILFVLKAKRDEIERDKEFSLMTQKLLDELESSIMEKNSEILLKIEETAKESFDKMSLIYVEEARGKIKGDVSMLQGDWENVKKEFTKVIDVKYTEFVQGMKNLTNAINEIVTKENK